MANMHVGSKIMGAGLLGIALAIAGCTSVPEPAGAGGEAVEAQPGVLRANTALSVDMLDPVPSGASDVREPSRPVVFANQTGFLPEDTVESISADVRDIKKSISGLQSAIKDRSVVREVPVEVVVTNIQEVAKEIVVTNEIERVIEKLVEVVVTNEVEKETIVTNIIEVPKEIAIEKIVERPVEVIVTDIVERIVEQQIVVTDVVEQVVEKIVEKEVEVEVVVTNTVEVEKLVEVPKEVVIEKIVERPVEVVVTDVVERVVEQQVVVTDVVERVVEKIVEKEVEVEVVVTNMMEVEKLVEVPKEIMVEKIVERPVEVIVTDVVERIVEQQIVVTDIVERVVEKPVEVIVEKEVIVPEVLTYEEMLGRLRTQVHRSVSDAPDSIAPFISMSAIGLLPDAELPPLGDIDALRAEDRLAIGSFQAFVDRLARTSGRKAADARETLTTAAVDLAASLRALEPVEIREAVLCSRINGYGAYTPFEDNTFKRTERPRILLYSELDNYRSKKQADGQFVVRLTQALSLYKEGKTDEDPVWQESAVEIVDLCRNVRSDFFLVQVVNLPEDLAGGSYELVAEIVDLVGGTRTSASIPLRIKR